MTTSLFTLLLITIFINPGSLSPENQQVCRDAGEWHFVINQATTAIPEITVVFENGAIVIVPLERITGTTMHYRTTENLDSSVAPETHAYVEEQVGNFNLSCTAPTSLEVVRFVGDSVRPQITILSILLILVCLVSAVYGFRNILADKKVLAR